MSRWEIPDTIWPTDNRFGIPALRTDYQADVLDMPFVAWGSVARTTRMKGTWHFFVDDYRFTALTKRPDQVPATGCVAAVEPDFSIYDQMPVAVALFRIYQKRWIARYWQNEGLRILVDLNVPPEFVAYNLLGIPRGWRAYATRGYNARLDQTRVEYEIATKHAGTDDVLFVVYGGGQDVRGLCMERRWTWIAEHADAWRNNHG